MDDLDEPIKEIKKTFASYVGLQGKHEFQIEL